MFPIIFLAECVDDESTQLIFEARKLDLATHGGIESKKCKYCVGLQTG